MEETDALLYRSLICIKLSSVSLENLERIHYCSFSIILSIALGGPNVYSTCWNYQ